VQCLNTNNRSEHFVKKITLGVVLGAAVALSLSACAAPPEESTASGSAGNASATDFTGCIISDAGGFEDKSFNESGMVGLEKAQSELGIQIKQAESKNANDFAPNLQSMRQQDCSLILTVGYMLAEATKAAAEENPDSHYAIIDDDSIKLDNVKSLIFKTSEAAYLAGYAAAAASESDTVATFGGIKIPTVTIFMDGFADGVAKWNEDSGESVKLLGWDKATQEGSFTGDFDDQSKGQNTAQNFIDQGADVIMPVAGPVGLGAAAAAQAAGNTAIVWVDTDGYESASQYKDIFLTSVVKEIGQAVYDTVDSAQSGEFSSTPYVGTLANQGVGIAPFHDYESKVPADLQSKIDDLTKQIISGELVVSSPSDPTVTGEDAGEADASASTSG
jgi:basic membrane protein A